MSVYTDLSANDISIYLKQFSLGEYHSRQGVSAGVENTNSLVDTTAGRFILTLYEKRVEGGDLPYFMALLDHLAARGNPVPPAIKDRDGTAIQTLDGRPACLIKFLSGVSVSHPTAAQARAAGVAMADMHVALADFPETRANSMGVETWAPLFERCGRSLDTIAPGLYDDLGFAIDRVVDAWPQATLDTVTIHADLFPDNVLMRGDAVSGLIDFYFACTDLRVYDLAIMHSAWAFDASGAQYDSAIGDALIAGYGPRSPLSSVERAAFPTLASGACIRFALSRAWDWLNTPADALVTRKDPLAYVRRLSHYAPELVKRTR
mgnify:FL=1